MGEVADYYGDYNELELRLLAWGAQTARPYGTVTGRWSTGGRLLAKCDPDDKPVDEFPTGYYYHKDSQDIYYSRMGNKLGEVQYITLNYPEILRFLPKNFWKAGGQLVSHFDTMTTSHLTNCYNWLRRMHAATNKEHSLIVRKMEEITTYLKTRQATASNTKTKGKEMDNESASYGSVAMGINSVQVRYVTSSGNTPVGSLYWFLTDLKDLKVGDYAIVYTSKNPSIVVIVSIETDYRRGHAWIVQKVDLDAYKMREELRKEREVLKKALDKKLKEQEDELRWAALKNDPEAVEMLARLEELKKQV